MPTLSVEPTKEYPVPYDTSDEVSPTFLEEVAVAGATAEFQVELGAPLEIAEDDAEREKALLAAVIKNKSAKNLRLPSTAFAAAAFLKTYGEQLAMDVASARAAITNKLMEIANCGDPKFELKALELLGKHSDIGLFSERSEITINYKSPEALEEAIKERVKRLLNADIIDITPRPSLEEALGFGEFDDSADQTDSEETLESGGSPPKAP